MYTNVPSQISKGKISTRCSLKNAKNSFQFYPLLRSSSGYAIQLSKSDYKRLLHKPYVNEVYLTGWNSPLKYCQHLENSIHCRKMCRSFNTKNFGSVGQRAAQLLAVKVRVLKKKSAASAIPPKVCASAFGPSSSTPGVKSFSKFDSQQLSSPLIYRLKIFSP